MPEIHVTDSGPQCPVFCDGKVLTSYQQFRIWRVCVAAPSRSTASILGRLAQEGKPVRISVRHINRLRVRWGLARQKGRPPGSTLAGWPVSASAQAGTVVPALTTVSHVGVHLFAAWVEQQGGFQQVVELLCGCIAQYRADHPEADFPLLHHGRETLLHRVQALFYAPLFGIGKLSGYDLHEHPLETLLGGGYHSSTLTQFLGQLERIDAGAALLPALLPGASGADEEPGTADDELDRIYLDGHMIAYWSTVPMHKGKITMLGRIMAGSQALIAHNQAGQAIWGDYQPPDIRMTHGILPSCQELAVATGVDVFVIDREVNSVELARAFHAAGLGLLTMLDRNQYTGLASWTTTRIGTLADGSPVYAGQWATPHPDDPRQFVLVETVERVVAYWGTPQVAIRIPPAHWPEVYRQRTHLQEQRFKEMKAYAALDVNFGTKKIMGPDRHQARARQARTEGRDKKLEELTRKASQIGEQFRKVQESLDRGHTTRLEQRQRRYAALEQDVRQACDAVVEAQQKLNAVGPETQRADRDFRKQLIMTIRTLLLDNALQTFLAALLAVMQEPLSLECLVRLLFERSGARLDTTGEVIYWINSAGLSVSYRRLLRHVVAGLCAMNMQAHGTPIRVYLRESPP
jgi:hypothetical protein